MKPIEESWILVNIDDVESGNKSYHMRGEIHTLFLFSVLPIINTNDMGKSPRKHTTNLAIIVARLVCMPYTLLSTHLHERMHRFWFGNQFI